MKRCPECRKDYFDESLLYCLDDGVGLVFRGSVVAEPPTAVLPFGSLNNDDKPTALVNGSTTTGEEVRSETRDRSVTGRRLLWAAWAILAAGLIAAIGFYLRPTAEQANVMRFSIQLPDKATVHLNYDMHNISVSPDGQHFAFVTNFEGQRRLWLRSIDALDAQLVPETDGAYSPFWSPDSRNVAFFAGGKLKRIDASGKSQQTICDLSGAVETSGTWGSEGVILYTDNTAHVNQIYRVTASGGVPTALPTKIEHYSRWPHFLSDGRHFVVSEWNAADPALRGIHVGSIDSDESKLVLETPQTRVEYAQGYLIFAREGSLLAQPFNEKTLQLSGEPIAVVERLPYFDQTGWVEFSVSNNGVLAYLTKRPPMRLVSLDRSGRETGTIGEPGWYQELRISPDGQKVAVTRADDRTASGDIWIQDLTRGTASRFAFGPNDDSAPVWSPDGKRIAYFSCCEGVTNPQTMATLRVKDVNDPGKGETPLGPGFQVPNDWSPDGRAILFTRSSEGNSKPDLWMLPVDGGGQPTPFGKSPFTEDDARFSPDGRWVAFTSNETGRNEVYVTRTEHPDEKLRVSAAGGRTPAWRRDGKEIYFLTSDKTLMMATVKAGDAFAFDAPVELFRNDTIDSFDAADGHRFIASSTTGVQAQISPFAVVVNWTSDLKHK